MTNPVAGERWFSVCGFDQTTEALLFERSSPADLREVRSMLPPERIDDDPPLVHCYDISREAVAKLGFATLEELPEADYFVNACQSP